MFFLGFAVFLLQELPYIIMPLTKTDSNPLMEMARPYPILNIFEKILMFSTIISMMFIVHGKTKWFSISSLKEKVFFITAVLLLIGYYIGWIFYFSGYQSR